MPEKVTIGDCELWHGDCREVLPLLPPTFTFTQPQIVAAFTEWDRRYREEPERFMSEACRLLRETPASYGQGCAPYFIQILQELAA